MGSFVRKAVQDIMRLGLTPTIKGQGYTVVKQAPEAGARVTDSSSVECIIWLSEQGL